MSLPNPEGRRHLEVVRNWEDLPEHERVIEAYARELLIAPDGTPRSSAVVSHSPFQHDVRTWTRAYFLTGDKWFRLNFYDDSLSAECVMAVSMTRFEDVFPKAKPSKGSEWLVSRSEKFGPTRSFNDPGYFRAWLESLWGPLPEGVQREIGVNQSAQQ